MGEENPWLYLLGGGSLTVLMAAFVKGLWDWAKGRHENERKDIDRRRDTISTLKSEVRDAERQADDERAERIRQQKIAGDLRGHAIHLQNVMIRDHHIAPSDLPPWPKTD